MCLFSTWEGVVPWMYQGGLSVEGERCGVSVCFTQSCSILSLLQGVGQTSAYFCLNWDTSPHLCGGKMGSVGVRGPTGRTRRIMDVVAGLQDPPEIPELPRLAKNCPGPSMPHQWQMAPSHTSWEEKLVANPEQLSGASSERVWGKRIPPERLSPVFDVGQCLSQSFRGVSKWSEHSWNLQNLSVNRQEFLFLWCLGR